MPPVKFVNLNLTILVDSVVICLSVEAAAVTLLNGNNMAVKLPSKSLCV